MQICSDASRNSSEAVETEARERVGGLWLGITDTSHLGVLSQPVPKTFQAHL